MQLKKSVIIILATAAFMLVALLISTARCHAISRGHAILQSRGLQIQAMVVPDDSAPGIDFGRFQQSNFTGVNLNTFDRSVNLSRYLGSAPGVDWGMFLNNGPNTLNSQEATYLSNLVSLQFHDELNVAFPGVLQEAKSVLANWRQIYPNTIGYLNHISSNSDAELRNYMSFVQPDMLMFATYPFNGAVAGGSPTDLYVDLQRFRKLGLAGHDGSGQQPIPYAHYLQTFTWPTLNGHHVSASEMRLNQFGAWAFGYTFATAFIYHDIPNESDFVPSLFNGAGDANPRQPAFSEMAETNRQSRNLGPALVRLLSSDVRMIMGQHASGNGAVNNVRPSGISDWGAGAGGNPFLVGVSAQNLGQANAGLPGDIVVGHFNPLQGALDPYFMIVNGLSAASGTVRDTAQKIRLELDFQASEVSSLLRLNRSSGKVEILPLVHEGGSQYHVDIALDGGTGDLLKYNNGTPFVGGYHLTGGYAVSGAASIKVVDGDGTSVLADSPTPTNNITGLTNGNVVARIGADVWQMRDAEGNVLVNRQLDNLGNFQTAVALGEGGYAAITENNVVFMAADGNTAYNVMPNSVELVAPLNNGNMVGRITGTDLWRIYTSVGTVHATRVLDNVGNFTEVAATGEGGYATATDSRIVFMGADGITVNNVVTDVVTNLTSLTNGNVVAQLGDDVWRLYGSTGSVLATRSLDNLGTFTGVVPLWGGGFMAYSDSNAVFMASDGISVMSIISDSLEFVTALNNGNVVGRLMGSDAWRLYSPLGDILATQHLGDLGAISGVAPLGQPTIPGDFDDNGVVNIADLAVWQSNYSTAGGASAATGDADSDGDVDGRDLVVWQRYFNATNTISAATVPEPTVLGQLVALGFLLSCAKRRKLFSSIAGILGLMFICAIPSSHAQSLSRGREILMQRGLQIHAMVVPHSFQGRVDLARFEQSGFTGLSLNSFDRSLNLSQRLGLSPDVATGLWIYNGEASLQEHELACLTNLVSLQWRDEQDISDPQQINAAREFLAQLRTSYPYVIGYLNQNGVRHTVDELRSYLARVEPDMVMFDIYPFNGQLVGGSPTKFYEALQKYRRLGLGGLDGTGQKPIPYALYLQTFTSDELNGHHPSPSEMRLNQFSAWAFGYTFATAFIYGRVDGNEELIPTLFDGAGDTNPRQPAFDDIAETNLQSRKLGSTLVRLHSTGVAITPGQHRSDEGLSGVVNTIPSDVPALVYDADEDPYLVGVSAKNVGSANDGLPGDVIVGYFKPMQGPSDPYFMIVNGLTAPDGDVRTAAQRIRMDFDFGTASVKRLLRLRRDTGLVEVLPLEHDTQSRYYIEIDLDGGTGDLFKYDNGTPFVGVEDRAQALIND